MVAQRTRAFFAATENRRSIVLGRAGHRCAAVVAATRRTSASLQELRSVVRLLAQDLELRSNKKRLVLVVASSIAGRTASVVSTAALGAFAAAREFDPVKFAVFQAAGATSEGFDIIPDAVLAPLFHNRRIHQDLVDYLFHGPRNLPAEEVHSVWRAVNQGKRATHELIIGLSTNVLGASASLVGSMILLATLNPLISAIAAASLPVLALSAVRIGRRGAAIRRTEICDQELVARSVGQLITSIDLVRSSPTMARSAKYLLGLLSAEHHHQRERARIATRGRLLALLPYHVSAATAGVVAAAVLHLPVVAVVTATLTAGWLYFPVKQLVAELSERTPQHIQDINHMYGALREGARQAREEREKDRTRIAASGLPGTEIHFSGVLPRFGHARLDTVIRPGEWMTMTAPSGTGKSLLLKMIVGSETPLRGTVTIGSINVADIARLEIDGPRRLVSDVVFYHEQHPLLHPDLSVIENLLLGSREVLTEHNAGELFTRASTTLRELGLSSFASRLADPLGLASGGEQRRLALARCIFRDPRIVVVDEPTAGLDDPRDGVLVADFLSGLQRQGVTIVCASNDPVLVARSTRAIPVSGGDPPDIADHEQRRGSVRRRRSADQPDRVL